MGAHVVDVQKEAQANTVDIFPARRLRLHNHPKMEMDLKVPTGHVIIDADVFMELINIHGKCVSVENGFQTSGKK